MAETSISINSNHFINSLESTIVQLVKVVQIENQVSIDEAKTIVSGILYTRANVLVDQETKNQINEVKNELIQMIKTNNATTLERNIYGLMKKTVLR